MMVTPLAPRSSQVRDAVVIEVGHANRPARGAGVWMVTGLANRPPPRPASTPSVFEPGLIVTRSVGPPGVSGPAATPAVASRLVTSGEPELVSIADSPVPAR